MHQWIRVIGWVGVFHQVGQGFVDGQGEVIHQGGGGAQCLQPLLEPCPQLAGVVRGGLEG